MVNAIQKPILVYVHGKKAPNMVVVTEKIVNNGKISIALELNEKGEVVDINNVSSVHTKDADTEIERLMNFTDKELQEALKFVVKEKVFDWFNTGRL